MKYTYADIKIREFLKSDIQSLADYWLKSPKGYLETLGISPDRFESEEVFKKKVSEKIRAAEIDPLGSPNTTSVIDCRGVAIGHHALIPMTMGESGVFHAHIWKPEFRGQGIGVYSYIRACEYYFNKYELEFIDFETPKHNKGPIRIKEKLGLVPIGEKLAMSSPLCNAGIEGWHYRIIREDMSALKALVQKL